jgi:uncharacterized protein
VSNVYGAQHRALQDQFDTRRLADLIEGGFIAKEIDDNNKAFIEPRADQVLNGRSRARG